MNAKNTAAFASQPTRVAICHFVKMKAMMNATTPMPRLMASRVRASMDQFSCGRTALTEV
jgi:hypothetical protein